MSLKQALEVFGLDSVSHLDVNGLKSLFKKLAKERHPDQGGSHRDFILLKEAHIILEKEVKSKPASNSPNNDLQAFTKEDILERYYKDTRQLQVQIKELKVHFENQAETLDQVTNGTQQLLEKFSKEKEKLKSELDESIIKLEKNYNPSLLQKVLFFLPKLNEKEFWNAYQVEVAQYKKRTADLDNELHRIILSVYGEGLNNIARLVGKVD
ncbi:MAG: hypothetical protein AAGF07_04060 [Patescibacteria group bacterium]